MDRRDADNRRKIPRFSSKPILENLKTLLKISYYLQGMFVSVAIILLALFVLHGQPLLAQFFLGGGSLIFAAFRLRDLNQKLKLFVENESITNLERTTNSIVLMWLLFAFIFTIGFASLVVVYWDIIVSPS